MSTALGKFFRFMFGGKRPLPASAAVVVGQTKLDVVEAPLASVDMLRRAMDAASAAQTEAPRPVAMREPEQAMEDLDPIPSLFLQGHVEQQPPVIVEEVVEEVHVEEPILVELPVEDSSTEEVAESEDAAIEALALEDQPPVASVEVDETDRTWLSQDWVEIEIADEPVPSTLSALQALSDPEREAVVEAAFDLARELLEEVEHEAPGLSEEVPLELPAPEEVMPPDEVSSHELESPEDESSDDIVEAEPVAEPEPELEVAAVADAPAKPAKKPVKKSAPAKKKKVAVKRKKAAPEVEALPLPDDAVYLTDAVIWSQCGSWREYWLPPTDANTSERVDEFRQMAASGKLTIWGLAAEAQQWTAIEPAHWKKNGFDPLSFLAGRENTFTETKTKKPVKFTSLKVSQAKVEELWQSDAARAAA